MIATQSCYDKAVILQTMVMSKLDQYLPEKNVSFSNDDQPWFTPELKEQDRRRIYEYRQHRRSFHRKSLDKKFSCTVCEIKFGQKLKAVTHVENKHVDCLQYKCPLCRASKGTRLAYESHLRRGHGARVMDYIPVIKYKKIFSV